MISLTAAQRLALCPFRGTGGWDERTLLWWNRPQATQTAQKRADSHQSGVSMQAPQLVRILNWEWRWSATARICAWSSDPKKETCPASAGEVRQ